MKFRLNYQVESAGFDYSVRVSLGSGRMDTMIQALADKWTDDEYHELCHQLHGTKMEFNRIDGECSSGDTLAEKKRYTVLSSLYRGVYWSTLHALDELDLDALEAEEEDQD